MQRQLADLETQKSALETRNAVLESTLTQTQEAARKDAAGFTQQLADLQTLKRQRSIELNGQVAAEKVLARKRSGELRAQISEVKEQAQQREQELKQHYEKQLAHTNESRNVLNEDKEELKRLYTERLRDLQESSQAIIKSLEAQLAESRTLKTRRSTELKAQVEAEKALKTKRSTELKGIFQQYLTDLRGSTQGTITALQEQLAETKELRSKRSAELRAQVEAEKALRTKRSGELKAQQAENRHLQTQLSASERVNQRLETWLDELKKNNSESENRREQAIKLLMTKSNQAARLAGRAEGGGFGRSQVTTFADSEDEASGSKLSRQKRSSTKNSRQSSTVLDQSDTHSEQSSQDTEAWTTRSELSDSSRQSVELDSKPIPRPIELPAEPLPLSRLLLSRSERFKRGLEEREQEYQESISSGVSSATRSQSSQAKSTHSQSSAKSGTSVTSWISDKAKSINSTLSHRDDKTSSDEGSLLSEPLKGRKGLVFKRTATRRILEEPYPSRKLRSNASVTSLVSKKSDASDQEYVALRKPDELASLYQESKQARNFELFEAIYNNKKHDIERILRDNPRAWKQKDKEGRNPIHWAAMLGQADTIDSVLQPLSTRRRQTLLNDADAKGLAPIHYAAEQNHVDAAAILANKYHADLSLKSNGVLSYRQNVFHIATDKGRSKLLRKLLPNAPIEALQEADAHEKTPLMYAAMRGQPKAIRALLRKKDINTLARDASHKDAFYHAVEHGVENKNWKPVRKFLQAKYRGRVKVAFDAHDPQLEYSSFGLLAAHAPKRVVKTALKFKHFNPNQSIFKKNWSHGYKFFTPFSLAASKGHVEGMEALAQDDRVKPRALSDVQARSAYHIALDHNQPEAEKFLRTSPLLKRLIKLNKRDIKGRSPKRVGIRSGATEAVESHLENSPGERKPLRYRKRDIEVGKMKRSDKATALDKLAEGGKRLRFR